MVYTKEIEAEMTKAVQWLADHGGSGVQDRYGHVVARGKTAKHIPALTWFRCVFSGRLAMPLGSGRIWTPEALAEIEEKLRTVEITHGGGVR